jgi:hypothetical protein
MESSLKQRVQFTINKQWHLHLQTETKNKEDNIA